MLGLSLVAMIALVLWGANAKKLTKETDEEFIPEPEAEPIKQSASRTSHAEVDLEEGASGSVAREKAAYLMNRITVLLPR